MIRLIPPLFLTAIGFAQSFEVASIKVHEGPMYRLGVSTSGQRLTADAANIRTLVMYAFDLKNYQVAGTASLLEQDEARWDIVAKAEGDTPPTKAAFRQMLQALLASRFQLKVHREMREMPVYAMVAAKSGIRFKESEPNADVTGHYSMKRRNNVITLPRATMSHIVDAISNAFLDRPVVDHTGLTGVYSIKLTYTPNTRANRESEPNLNDIGVFQALEEQLGLKLEARQEPVQALVVDRIEKPSENEP
ncbi:MAG: TIGR03435 family protein [Ignavibacteriota bacterium]